MAKSIGILCVLLALLGAQATTPLWLAAAAKNKDRPLLDEKMTKQDEREAKCLARAKSCEAMDRCLNYKKCGDKCAYKTMQSGGKKCPELPTAWEVISTDPDLKYISNIISMYGLAPAFNTTLTSTLLLPTNEAVAAYLADVEVPLSPYYKYSYPWIAALLQYHFLLRRVYSYQLRPIAYSTFRKSINALPHKVTAVANSTCPTGNKGSKGCQSSYYLRDEQGNNITFAKVDARVSGGGVIHVINSILQAKDVFPNFTAALTRNPTAFSELTNFVLSIDKQLVPYNISILDQMEQTGGTLAAPVNSAFIGLDTKGLTLQYATQTLLYHFCPLPWFGMGMYTPFPDESLALNPCDTALAQLHWELRDKFTVPGLLYTFAYISPLKFDASISYTSGKALPPPAENMTNSATILVADILTPLGTIMAIDKVMLPPTGYPNPPINV